AKALARVAEALVAAGSVGEAERVAARIGDARVRAKALARVAEALVAAGSVGEAERVAARIGDARGGGKARARGAEALAAAGLADEAGRVAQHAMQAVSEIADALTRARGLAQIAKKLARAGLA